jgi:hypothetical protein
VTTNKTCPLATESMFSDSTVKPAAQAATSEEKLLHPPATMGEWVDGTAHPTEECKKAESFHPQVDSSF